MRGAHSQSKSSLRIVRFAQFVGYLAGRTGLNSASKWRFLSLSAVTGQPRYSRPAAADVCAVSSGRRNCWQMGELCWGRACACRRWSEALRSGEVGLPQRGGRALDTFWHPQFSGGEVGWVIRCAVRKPYWGFAHEECADNELLSFRR